METQVILLLYILLGAVAGMIYSLRRIVRLERLILALDEKITKKLGIAAPKPGKKKK